MVHLPYLILSGPWGARYITGSGEKEEKREEGKDRVTKYVYELSTMWCRDQGCTLSTLFSNYICYMTAVCVCATDLNCYSKLCFVRSVKKKKPKTLDFGGSARNT